MNDSPTTDGQGPYYSITRLVLSRHQTNCYIISCRRSREALVVDAPGTAEEILPHIESLHVRYFFLTHTHADHTGALKELRRRVQAPLAVHREESDRVEPPPQMRLGDGDTLSIGSLRFSVIHTPGHTPGSACLYHPNQLIAGDTIFPGGPGHTARPADFKQIVDSITSKLFPLPDDTTVLPGHGEATVLSKEKKEYAAFARRPHPADLCGDVVWLSSQ
ncbi:MAG: MBL fold metallo-hydrolase [Chloroflexi bacterium]|nr:MBL fold metallo-hydrolase [Chloroflexota bacterium]